MTTARYNQPSSVRSYVMSPHHFWFGLLALKSCFSRFSDTGCPCSLWLTVLNRQLRLHKEYQPV
ncbi:hypothetical protein JOE09_002720 [Pantoea coffeiphila]|nr:hypothetical protein [Pantoea coffeiphila]